MHPGVRVELITSTRVLNFVQEKIDLAIRIRRAAGLDLVARQLAPTARVLWCAAVLRRAGPPLHPDDLREQLPRVDVSAQRCNGSSSRRASAQGRVSGDVASADPLVLERGVLQGGGVAMLPLWVVEESVATHKLEVVLSAYEALQWGRRNAVYAVYPTRRHLPPKVRAFLAFVVEALAK
jgi:DNA-binding transcriptional LysR family regulator